jgi:hypothetical protein
MEEFVLKQAVKFSNLKLCFLLIMSILQKMNVKNKPKKIKIQFKLYHAWEIISGIFELYFEEKHRIMHKLGFVTLAFCLSMGWAWSQQCIDFEQFTTGDVFQAPAFSPGDTLDLVDGLALVLAPFTDGNGEENFFNLQVRDAENNQFVYGERNYMFMGGGLSLDFSSAGGSAESVYIYYKQGANLIRNLEVNGVQRTTTDFSSFPDDWTGDVTYRHQFQERMTQGIIILEGTINDLVISGEALEIDNICFSRSAPGVVFPGDTNHDGKCDYRDFLYIGVGIGKAGPFRTNGSNSWTAQNALDWKSDGPVNLKYADANGDGFINEADFETVSLDNIGRSHDQGEEIVIDGGDEVDDFAVFFEKEDPASPGGPDTVIYQDGEPMQPLALYLNPGAVNDEIYGLSWVWQFNEEFIESATFDFEMNNEMGQDGNMRTFLDTSRIAEGILACTVVRTDGSPAQITQRMDVDSFNGIIVDLVGFRRSDDDLIDVDSIQGIDRFGDPVPVFDLDSIVIFAPEEELSNEEINPWASGVKIFPNPASNVLSIELPIEAGAYLKQMCLFNETGQKVLIKENVHTVDQISVDELPAGNYFLELNFEDYPSVGKSIQIQH